MGEIFRLGGHASNTDRKNQLESWGNLKDIMYNSKATGIKQTNEGAAGLSSAADYFKALMSGDQAKMSQVLAPQISVIQNQKQQQLNTASQFGNRSGGTNASMQRGTEDATRSVQELFDMLGPEAAKEFATISGTQEGLGSNLLGISANSASNLGAEAGHTRAEDRAGESATADAGMQAVAALLGLL
jgi:hypothetical protein